MIRVTRPSTVLAALANTNVQTFIQQSAAYKASPTTAPKPKRPTRYRTSDLLTAFDMHFHAKCYLTEQKFASAWEMDVDHFEPVSVNSGRVLDWTNIYPVAHKANVMRGDQFPAGGLLDPCSAIDNVEQDIVYTLVEQGEKPGFHARDPTNVKAVNTAQLLDTLHNGRPGSTDSYKSTIHYPAGFFILGHHLFKFGFFAQVIHTYVCWASRSWATSFLAAVRRLRPKV